MFPLEYKMEKSREFSMLEGSLMCQGVRNVSFSENFKYMLNE